MKKTAGVFTSVIVLIISAICFVSLSDRNPVSDIQPSLSTGTITEHFTEISDITDTTLFASATEAVCSVYEETSAAVCFSYEETAFEEVFTSYSETELSYETFPAQEESVTELTTDEIKTELPEETVPVDKNEETYSASSAVISLDSPIDSQTGYSAASFGKKYSGILLSFDDVEEYSFYAQERGYISFVFSHGSFTGTGGWIVTLESRYFLNGKDGETAYREISSTICKSDKTKHLSVNVGVLPGNYRLVVRPYQKTVEMQFDITVAFTACPDYETECNDSKTRYTELFAGIPLHGTASFADRTDTDWYLLRMFTDGVISLKFEHPASDSTSVCWRVSLYDSDGNELYSENSPMSSKLTDSGFLGLVPGVYFVKIESRVYSPVIYTLTAERMSSALYERENNDSLETATKTELNKTIYGNTASRQGKADRDYYSFDITKSGTAVLTFGHDEIESKTDKKGWNVSLTDSSGNVLCFTEGYYLRNKTVLPVIGLAPGRYYVCVDCDNCYRNDVDYSILLSFEENAFYETEPNNDRKNADALKEGVALGGNLNKGKTDYDNDFFVIDITKKGKADFTFTHRITGSDKEYFRINISDSSGNPVVFYTSEGLMCEGSVSCTADIPKLVFSSEFNPGKYYINITTGDYYSDSAYTISYQEVIYK